MSQIHAFLDSDPAFSDFRFGGWWWYNFADGSHGNTYFEPPSKPASKKIGLFIDLGIVELVNFCFTYLFPLALECGWGSLHALTYFWVSLRHHDEQELELRYMELLCKQRKPEHNVRFCVHFVQIPWSFAAGLAIIIVSATHQGNKVFLGLRSGAMIAELIVGIFWLYRARGRKTQNVAESRDIADRKDRLRAIAAGTRTVNSTRRPPHPPRQERPRSPRRESSQKVDRAKAAAASGSVRSTSTEVVSSALDPPAPPQAPPGLPVDDTLHNARLGKAAVGSGRGLEDESQHQAVDQRTQPLPESISYEGKFAILALQRTMLKRLSRAKENAERKLARPR